MSDSDKKHLKFVTINTYRHKDAQLAILKFFAEALGITDEYEIRRKLKVRPEDCFTLEDLIRMIKKYRLKIEFTFNYLEDEDVSPTYKILNPDTVDSSIKEFRGIRKDGYNPTKNLLTSHEKRKLEKFEKDRIIKEATLLKNSPD